MNINIKIDPTAFGKSGYLALCPYCLKTTEYFICCNDYKLNVVDASTIDELCEIYDLNAEQRWQLFFDFDEWESSQPDKFEVACDAYRAWCKSGKNFKTSQHLFDAWDAAVMAYAERYSVTRAFAVDKVYREVEAEYRDERVK